MTGPLEQIRQDGPAMALAVVGILVVVALAYGIFLGSVRILLPVVYPLVPSADPTVVAALVGFVPAALYGVVVAAVIRRRLLTR
jgi:hypothetical protein